MTMINRKPMMISLLAVFLTLMFAGNIASAHNHNQTIGMVIGAATGGYLGSHVGERNKNEKQKSRHTHVRQRQDHPVFYRHPRYEHPVFYQHPRSGKQGYYHKNNLKQNYTRRDNDDTVRLIATASGVFFGALIGSEIGRYMDDVDRMRAREANYMAHTAPLGSQITWNNPQSYNSGTITPTRDGYSEAGQYCREFYQTVAIGGRSEAAYGVACYQPDGSWRIVQARQ